MNQEASPAVRKVKPPSEYPPEEGHYLRGNDYSPVAVAILLHTFYDRIPEYLQRLASVAIENGAALAGMLQTENIGIEKIVCNIVANPNIRFLIVCGVESSGHQPGQALSSLMRNGVDERRNIVGAEGPTPYLYNIPLVSIERLRKQVTLIELIEENGTLIATNLEQLGQAIKSCYQESPTQFMSLRLYDLGAYPEPAICSKLTWRISKPWAVTTETEAKVLKSIQDSAKKPRELSDKELLSLLRPPPHDSETSKKDGEKRI
jgi:tetrahydromethanopterin S-methyltransferase subunit A